MPEPADGTPSDALQQAAVELIGAARSFLDAAEAIVRDPGTLRSVAGGVTGMLKVMGEAFLAAPGRAGSATGAPPAPGEPPVERIDLG
ncbi:MAG: hypothetical protein ACKO91_04570 [Acidimicrobiales bacterium]